MSKSEGEVVFVKDLDVNPNGFRLYTLSTHYRSPINYTDEALDVYVKDRVAENAARVGAHMKQRLKDEFLPLPCVGDISGLGLHLGIELVNDKQGKAPLDVEVQNELRRKVFDAGI